MLQQKVADTNRRKFKFVNLKCPQVRDHEDIAANVAEFLNRYFAKDEQAGIRKKLKIKIHVSFVL